MATRYGMKWTTIRYWQMEGHALWTQRGLRAGAWVLHNPQDFTAREVGHAAIAFAQTCAPATLRRVLDGVLMVTFTGEIIPTKLGRS